MNHFSIIVLKTQLEQQEKLLEQYRKEKTKLNWEGKQRIENNIELIKENISDLKASIQIIDEVLNSVVGKSEISFYCSTCTSFSLNDGEKMFELIFESRRSKEEYSLILTQKELEQNPFIKTKKISIIEMLDLMNKFSKQKTKK